ncbi:MAG: serine/threonine-protein kinase [Acidobacteria bacterium]|nr:serine/threonine-protein kinase [Acidobacteriota bacterium]
MNAPRWEKLESLFNQVLEAGSSDREALLRQAGDADSALEAEVRRLLTVYEEDTEFLENRPGPVAIEVGAVLCGYRLEGVLGEGGMGIVYRARRGQEAPCAIKVLRPEALANPALRRRFQRECDALCRLRHPNIVRVYGVERDPQERHLLVMELVEGELLSAAIRQRALPLETALDYAAQIAAALAASHDAGLVHRDIKPQNLMVSPEGKVKLLDFGLCRWSVASGLATSRTYTGMLLGTAPYMSPEQAQGLEVDARSDVFSFGAVLYEMISGAPAFEAANPIATLAAILHRDPPPVQGIPEQVQAVMGRCLGKQPEDRYASAKELSLAIESLREDARRGRLGSRASRVVPGVKWATAGAVAILCVALGWTFWPQQKQAEPLQQILTPEFYLAVQPAVSSDGKWLAFSGSKEGEGAMDIWVQPLAGGTARQLTAAESGAQDPSFSPDGANIVYRADAQGGQLFIVPTAGGSPRRIADLGRRPRYSPDGKWIAYWTGPEGSNDLVRAGAAKVFVVSSDGGMPRQVGADLPSAFTPVWSPDGRALLVMGPNHSAKNPRPTLWLVRLDGGLSKMLHYSDGTELDAWEPLEWRDSGVISFLTSERNDLSLVEMTLSPKSWVAEKPVVVSALPKRSSRPARLHDRLIYATTSLQTSIWTLRVKDNGMAIEPARMNFICPGTFCMPRLANQGRQLAYSSYHNRWTLHTKTLEEVGEKILESSAELPPWMAVDGAARHVFVGGGPSREPLFRLPFGGGSSETVCARCMFPWDVSPNGRFLLTMSDGAVSTIGMASLPAERDKPFLVHPEWNLYQARFSPDGRWILFSARTAPDVSRVMAAPFDPESARPPERWVTLSADDAFNGPAGWSARGDRVYYASYRDGYRCIWTQAVDELSKQPVGEPKAVAHFHSAARSLKNVSRAMFGFSVSGDQIAYELGEVSGKIHSTLSR